MTFIMTTETVDCVRLHSRYIRLLSMYMRVRIGKFYVMN